jgi:sulfur-carrier protein
VQADAPAVKVWVQGTLLKHTGGRATLDACGTTVRELVEDLDRRYPGFRDAIVQDGYMLRPGISVAVDGNVVKRGLLQTVEPGSEVYFIPAIGGG